MIIVNKNSVPNDPRPPFYPSGIRLGTPAVTTRGMEGGEMEKIAEWILKIVDHVKSEKLPRDKEKRAGFIKAYKLKVQKDKFLKSISLEVKKLCKKFPLE